MSHRIPLDIDASNALKKLADVERERKEVEDKVDQTLTETKQKTKLSFNQVVGAAQQLWATVDATIAATGGAISTQFRALITAAFSTINILTPLLTAQAVTPGMQAQAAIGFANIGMAFASLYAAQYQEQLVSQKLAESMQILNGIQGFIGAINYW